MTKPLLEAKGFRKSFGGVPALKDGRFTLERGSVHALCGGNGAGKSTFLKIIMGIHHADAGTLLRNGSEISFADPAEALANGISIIEQELSPVPAMSVAENIYLGREPVGLFGRIDFRTMNRNAQELLDGFRFGIRADTMMMDLTVAQTQLVEIAKALSYDAEVIIMDEPTSALGEAEADQLFEAVETLKARGKGVIYVSHRLSEIFTICDSYTVFRDGSFVEEGALADIDKERLINLIVGRPLTEEFVKENAPGTESTLSVSGLSAAHGVRDVTFSARRGEILALYGLMGSGRSEIFDRLFGLSDQTDGQIVIEGAEARIRTPNDAIAAGLAYVTEDRKRSGLVLTGDVRDNLCLATLDRMSAGQVMNARAEGDAAARMIDTLNIKTASDRLGVSNLSGGNQQKVVLGKWFLTEPRILLLDEPTRGVDVGAKREIYRVMSDFTRQGGTVIMISSETDEVLGMADRAIVMRDGRVAGELERAEMSAEKLLHLAA
ncbi:MAG: sugar ABC transporter ATP-binding protein [Rhodobacteraceae bacterium]|uniref:Monosaccharide ABC transporter ATP-binding protein, CUT2 family n=1 Tax=Salipiger profundus TaxID=1229727 RepID=A0A1U7D8S6_9RHOB|nr:MULTISPECIES: sugar ABC transporter ATP-binding protein [Salipiger]APX24466.1 monosaccharide ABC transporter ATP-binding protein, CUT2 family [Salipiger profundus]MAB07234.1 sugar ABC transporter ATP-binding protein [Paracoccaceae bacterium]GGA18704.1 sugar ABC transporter ATP-binding protein [Salipiger profundus]SFD39572.1 monosaccharide ABC transporter ATP-binding protein, CUT2 family [Salipiger profundus]